ncbi:MAG: redoxin domain-containing protein [Planctomycetota bacterium]|nr:redoxin domain-containing protein [Planctomycetota bacterium]
MASMPHLSELQAKHADDGVTIIGVTREDRNNSIEAVRKMTADKGDTMGYTVAWDDAGKTYADYMTAAGQTGIPTSFLIDREGKVAYIGHPSRMDIPIAMVVAGTWDPVTGPKEMQAMQTLSAEIRRGAGTATKAQAEDLLKKLAEFSERWPDQAGSLAEANYQLLVAAERPDEAAPLGRRIVAAAIAAKDSMALNSLAWGIVDPQADPASRDLGLALHAATVASALTGNADAAILDTLARVHFGLGNLDRAIELQEQAVDLAKADKGLRGMLAGLEAALQEYLGARD